MSSGRILIALIVGSSHEVLASVGELSGLGVRAQVTASSYEAMRMLCHERIDMVIFEATDDPESATLIEFLVNSRAASLAIAIVEPGKSLPVPLSARGIVVLNRPLQQERLRAAIARHYELERTPRGQPRVALNVPVTVILPSAQYVAVAVDLTAEGIGVRLPHPLEPGAEVEVSFTLPGNTEIVRAAGKITWINQWGNAGIHLLAVPSQARASIAAYIAEKKTVGDA